MTREETIQRLKELGFENPVNEEGRIDLNSADLRDADLAYADLAYAEMTGANLEIADLYNADLGGADLKSAKLTDTHLGSANLAGANLQNANLWNANLSGAGLEHTNLSRGILVNANLSHADMTSADLRDANLRRAILVRTNLHSANLGNADMIGTILRGTILEGANIEGAILWGTMFGNVDLRKVKGLETVHHQGASTIGLDTIFRSEGKIPEVFLRGAGVPDDFINYMGSLVGRAIEFYSVFISYSSKDGVFAQRLYNDLQAKGVRCWYAPEKLRIGDDFRETIDQAVRLHDKVLLILSERSVNSQWVEQEVETALRKERKQGTTVLFPLRLDDAVMETSHRWAQEIRRTRQIGDFRRWEDHDSYPKAFSRLLRDLTLTFATEGSAMED